MAERRHAVGDVEELVDLLLVLGEHRHRAAELQQVGDLVLQRVAVDAERAGAERVRRDLAHHPVRPVVADQPDHVAGADAQLPQAEREGAGPRLVLAPGDGAPDAEFLLAQRDFVAVLAGVAAQQLGQVSAEVPGVMARSAPWFPRGFGRLPHHLVGLAEIGAADMRVGQHLLRTAFGDLAAEVEHHHAVRDVHHHAHVVLDHEHGHAPLLVEVDDEAGHVLLFLEVHARHRLVEQDQLGLQRHGARQLDALAEAVGELARHRLADVLDLQEVDDLLDLAPVRDLLAPGAAEPPQHPGREAPTQQVVAADHDVLEHRHVPEQRQVLEGAADADRARACASAAG